jgi:hypothetical protein
MGPFRKYSFGSKGAATTKINALGVDDNGDVTHSHTVVRLGNIIETEATYNEDGTEATPAVYTDTYHVDVLWDGEPDEDWDNQLVWCKPPGVHVFGSTRALKEWSQKCKELHPEYFPEPEPEEGEE